MPRIKIPVAFCNKVAPFVILAPFCNNGFRFPINQLPQFVISKLTTFCNND